MQDEDVWNEKSWTLWHWFIDPNTVNEKTWTYKWYLADVEKNMLDFLKRLNTNEDILLPYNYTLVTDDPQVYGICRSPFNK